METLTHWTNETAFFKIISEEIKGSEKFLLGRHPVTHAKDDENKDIVQASYRRTEVPMICFAEKGINNKEEFHRYFGKFGLRFPIDYIIDLGACPVIYFNPVHQIWIDRIGGLAVRFDRPQNEYINFYLNHIQPKKYNDESEWRIVGQDWNAEFYLKEDRTKQYSIKYDFNRIVELVVPEEHLNETLELTKNKWGIEIPIVAFEPPL